MIEIPGISACYLTTNQRNVTHSKALLPNFAYKIFPETYQKV